MRQFAVVAVAFLGMAVLALAQESQSQQPAYLLKVYNNAGESSYCAMSAEETKLLTEDVRLENSLHQKALMLSEKKWKEDAQTAKKSFPRSAISPRRVQEMERFKSLEEAQKKKDALEQREAEREKPKVVNPALAKVIGKPAGKETTAKKDSKELEKESLNEQARTIYAGVLEELKTAAKNPEKKESSDKPADKKE